MLQFSPFYSNIVFREVELLDVDELMYLFHLASQLSLHVDSVSVMFWATRLRTGTNHHT